MTEQEDPRQKSRRDLLLVLLILPLGVLCMFVTGQTAIRLAPEWVLKANMRSLLDPNAEFAARGNPFLIEPLNPGILTQPAWGDLFLTPNAPIPTRLISSVTPLPVNTPLPPLPPATPVDKPVPTATFPVFIVFPTRSGPLQADLKIEKSDNSQTYTPGTAINYTILVTNYGPDNVPRFNVTDNLPAAITGLIMNCTPAELCGSNTSSGNNISYTGAALPSSGINQITISVSGTVAAGATGDLVNTASVAIPSGVRVIDPYADNNTVSDRDTQLSVYDLAITKSDAVDTYTRTNPINYTIVVTNSGPSDALGVTITDNIPAQISSWTWTCATVIGASGCNGVTDGTSNFTDTVNIQSGGRIEYSVRANPTGVPQNIVNTASVVLPSGPSFMDPNLANNSAIDTDIPYIDLQITKDDGVLNYTPGGSVTYGVTVTNNSTFKLSGITVSDPKPVQVTSWTWCVSSPCPAPINADFTSTINLAAGSSLVYTVTANLAGTVGLGDLTNTATVSPPAGLVDALPGNNSATDIDTLNLSVDLQISKDDGVLTYTPGGTVNYTVVVTNNSAINLNGISVTDKMPALISSWAWSCAPAPVPPGASCTTGPSNGNINDTAVNLSAGAAVIYTINANVNGAARGDLSNTASVNPPAGFTEAVPGDNTATDTDFNAVGEPDIGPPDGNIYSILDGTAATFYLSQPIIANGDAAADFVFYEFPMTPGIRVDQIIVEISLDSVTWQRVFFWGDTTADTNTNLDNVNLPNIAAACPKEFDNCPVPDTDLYPYPGTGIAIDVDNSPLSAPLPPGNYFWIRFTEPGLTAGDGADVDAIEILP